MVTRLVAPLEISLSRRERDVVISAMPGEFCMVAIHLMEFNVLYKKCGLIWLCSILYSYSLFCRSSSILCSIRSSTFSERSFMVFPISPSSWGHSVDKSLEKSPSSMRLMRACNCLTGRFTVRERNQDRKMPIQLAAATVMSTMLNRTLNTLSVSCDSSTHSAIYQPLVLSGRVMTVSSSSRSCSS